MDLYLKIATQIKQFFKHDAIELPLEIEGKILRIEVPIPQVEPLSWLARQQSDVKTYWADRQGRFTMAGIGTIDTIASDLPISYAHVFDRLRQNLSSLFPKVRYYGGIGFSQDRWIDPSWKLFGNYRFVVPRFEIWTDGIETFFACNCLLTLPSGQWDRELDLILAELIKLDLTQPEIAINLPPIQISRLDTPNRYEWSQNVELSLAKFADFQLEKIVLARKSTLTFASNLQPQLLLLLLQPNNHPSYHFCFQIDATTAFIGTSPERLYYRHDRLLKTEAIAGTRHRGASTQSDIQLSEELQSSPKDIREHQLVVDHLQSILAQLCQSVELNRAASILKLNKVQHLYTQFQGILTPDVTDADILPQLHPTPAVGGVPRIPALKLIQELEPFERGWYAAPVGWVGADDAEFAVAIRSGLIDRHRLLLFAGAGIVTGSQAEEEWIEIENKIRHFTDLFTFANSSTIAGHRSHIER
ncbi:isochorismate synthase MenF [Chamaesiphon sp. GL140_3_metabinner_50]|uniref:isochorismate synthase n=1 Tax=Chamaesiphon sp. GL140_3_metabinner_50 TaxID=2970812 RepID=UPI0025E36DAF|nr:isochorismate synthase [Chamaesiphon sp. GL140_3_metabinner_50]